MHSNININDMTLYDLEQIKDTLITDFDNFWNYNIFKQELEQVNSYFIVAKKINNDIVGFAGFKKITDEADIMNIVVKKSFRNMGIGSLLLGELIKKCTKLEINQINLEVNENNISAISLYKKFGFKKTGIRKNYYNNCDNAILMSNLFY